MNPVQNVKAYELLSLLEQIVPVMHSNMKDFTITTDDDNDDIDSRTGISSSYNNFEHGCNHFFFFAEMHAIYFSKNIISLRYNHSHKTRKIYDGSFSEFFEVYFQLIMVHDLLPIDFYKRIYKISQDYKWKIK